MASTTSSDDVPEELEDQCTRCHVALAGIERLLQSVMGVSRTQTEDKLDTLDAASEILLLTYTMNSLFWVYLATHGVDPKSHPIKRELERVQKAMKRAKLISDKKKQVEPRINTDAAKRFVRNALWEAEEQERVAPEKEQTTDGQNGDEGSSRKRKMNSDQDNPGSSKRTRV